MNDQNWQGWYHLLNARKWHYFKNNSTSLCGRYWVLALNRNDLQDDNHDSPDNCVACQRKRAKLAEQEARHEQES